MATQCKHPGDCPRKATRKGWCDPHYRRWRKTGDPGPAKIRLKIDDWETGLRARIEVRGPRECWPWTGLKTKKGYGVYYPKGAAKKTGIQRTTAHRLIYELDVGPIPDGYTIDHVKARGCVRIDCCNPAHLEPVTRGVNNLRGTSPAAINARKTHCGQGHKFTPANTYINPRSGKRRCRTCLYERYLSSKVTDQDAILAQYGMVCHLCGEPIRSRDDLHFDHVVPIDAGGRKLTVGNVLPAHMSCNLSKGSALPGALW